VQLRPETAEAYVRYAFAQMLSVADRVGEPGINERPFGDGTNAIAALVIHCCEVAEFWLGHVALGRATTRDRDSEFSRTASLAELHELVDTAADRIAADIGDLDAGRGVDEGGRQFLLEADASDAAVVLHVLEELYQHLGHMELAADALVR
jgi:hypothetical protein